MSYNYNSLLGKMMPRKMVRNEDPTYVVPIRQSAFSSFQLFFAASVFLLFGAANAFAQSTTIIDPTGDGGFYNGNTFAANGWTVANDGVGPIKWSVGANASGTTSSCTLNGTTTVTLSQANPKIVAGQSVYGMYIPAGAIVQSISVDGLTLTLSAAATSSASVTLGFGAFPGAVSVDAKQATGTATTNLYSVTLAASNPNISVGMAVSGNNIAANTYVASINGTTLGLSKPATATVTSATVLTFSATSSAISGNAAYISNDNGATNSYAYATAAGRTVYFYRDITNVTASQTAMTLTFDVKSVPSSSAGWQVWVAPVSQSVVGVDTQVTTAFNYSASWPGATLISFNADPQIAATKTTAFIPPSFAGKPFRLIFVWTNTSSAGTLPPASIDNISLVARAANPSTITCAQSGLWSQPTTWTGAIVPTPADAVGITDIEGAGAPARQVMVDSRFSGCSALTLSGTNSWIQFATATSSNATKDDFTVYNGLTVSGSNAVFYNQDAVNNGKIVKLGGDLSVGTPSAVSRFDSNAGKLTLNGSALQTITVDPQSSMGGPTTQTAVNTYKNTLGVLNTLEVTNTSTAFPNVQWNADMVRISTSLILTTGKVNIGQNKRLILGNFCTTFSSTGPTNNPFPMTVPQGYGFTGGTVSRWIVAKGTVVQEGNEIPASDTSGYPFIGGTGLNRTFYFLPDAAPLTDTNNGNLLGGEVAVTYTDATTTIKNLSIADGNYTITDQYGATWKVATPEGKAASSLTSTIYQPDATVSTNRIGVFANGAFEALNGSARLMRATTVLPGNNQNGTAKPFAFRTGLTLTDLTAAAVYIGINSASSAFNSATGITSNASGDWNAPATWVGNQVPACGSAVTIAPGHNVTVTTTASASAVLISQGASLTSNANGTTMTVGCTNNNNAFKNYGTYTMKSGTLQVNGSMSHYIGSFFNHTGGDIIIDSNNNGDVATSVAFGGASCRIETSNLNLTGGKITIVDPLVNIGTPFVASSLSDFTLNTAGPNGGFMLGVQNDGTGAVVAGDTRIKTLPVGQNVIVAGMVVSGPEIPAGTTVVSASLYGQGGTNLTLSQAVTAGIPQGLSKVGSVALGANIITGITDTTGIVVGQVAAGPGFPDNTTVTAVSATSVTLSNSASSAATGQTYYFGTAISFSSITNNLSNILVDASASNANLTVGQTVSGTGIQTGTTIKALTNTVLLGTSGVMNITLSKPTTTTITSQQVLTIGIVVPGNQLVRLTAGNSLITKGSLVSGTGIKPGTFVAEDPQGGAVLTLSEGILPGAPSPLLLSFQSFNTQTSGSFIYTSPNPYAAGLNHTLQIGDGVSTQNTSQVTNGFNCQFQAGGGLLSLGNLTVNAQQTAAGQADRFMNVSDNGVNGVGNMNVQNAFTVTDGSIFKKSFPGPPAGTQSLPVYTSTIYVGGNLVNDGTINTAQSAVMFYMGNFINNTAVATTLPQTISGKGTFANNLYFTTPGFTGASMTNLTVNNTSTAGVTLNTDNNNFRVLNTVQMTNGILHTSDNHTLFVGNPDATATTADNITGTNPTSYVDGPVSMVIPNTTDSSMQTKLLALGAKGKFLPIILGTIGGAEFKVQAFDDNVGTVNTANATNKSTSRWSVSRVGTSGAFNTYQVGLEASDITAYSTIVQSATANGTYDLLATPAPAIAFSAGTPNLIKTPNAGLASSGFLGNFSYATAATILTGLCTATPAPGLTKASTITPCGGQSIALSLTASTAGSNVTYQWQSSTDGGTTWANIAGATAATYTAAATVNTSYQNIVTCTGLPSGTSTPIAVTIAPSTVTTTDGSTCTTGPVTLMASGSSNLSWYDAPVGGNLVATGSTYSPTVAQTTTYYVSGASAPAVVTVNPVDKVSGTAPLFAGTVSASTLYTGIAFDVTKRVQLATVRVFPKNTIPLPVTIGLFNSAGNLVGGTTPVTFTPTSPAATAGTVAQDVTLNYDIPVGTGYRLAVISGLNANNALGTDGTTISYPLAGTSTTLLGNVTSLSAAPTVTANKTNYFFNLAFNEYCEAARKAVTATVSSGAPTATAQTFCNSATVANLTATGTGIIWYAQPTGGTALVSTTALSTGTYYASQTNGCESSRTAVSVTVKTTQVPTAIAQAFCSSATVADLVATGTGIQWYSASTGGTALVATTALTTATTYYASQTVNGCESSRTAVLVTISTSSAPTASAQSFCGSATVANLTAAGTAIQWYAQQTGGTALTSATALSTGTYYASQTVGFTCESFRTPVQVAVNPIPSVPTASAQTFCNSATVANLVASGTGIQWYSASTGGTVLAPATALTTATTYYASQTANGCESLRTAVLATINTSQAPTASAQSFCGSATVANLTAAGTAIQWYAQQTGGTALSSTTALTTATTYYASQTANGCESSRTAVSVTVKTTSAPTALAQLFCSSATVADLVASGTGIQWYSASTGGAALTLATALATGTTYYASQTVNGCESLRTAELVTIGTSSAPTASAQSFCGSATVANLTAAGTGVQWYAQQTGGTALASATALATATTYYASQTVGSTCESSRTPVQVTVNSIPAVPTAATTQGACSTGTIADFVVAPSTDLTWHNAAVAGNLIPTSTQAVLNTTYYVSQTLNGCEGPRLGINAGSCLPVEEFKISELTYYPNPVSDQLTITANDAITRVELYNLLGQKLKVIDTNSNNILVNFNEFAQSTYLVKVYSENKVEFFKVVKK